MQESKEQQLFFMRRAIQLGERGRHSAPPNPWVGCVIVQRGSIIGEGFHAVAGEKHAEVIALEEAGELARGATAYISLEPCPHYGKTPPCVEALVRSGIGRVVIPLLDPDAHVSGKGIEHLAQAGIEVVTGIGREEAAASLAPYLHQRLLKRPFCLLKAAISMDGRIAACDGSSQWITSAEARENGHLLRSQSQAIVVGAETVLADRPTLTARGVPIHKQPLRVLLDSRGRVPVTGALADTTLAPTLVCTSSREKEEAWKEKGVDVLYSPKKIELPLLLTHLAQLGVIQLLIEGGSSLYAHFLSASLVDQITLYVGNCLLGDQAKPLLSSLGIPSLVEAPRWSLQSVCRLGESARLDFTPFAERETSS